MRKVSISLRNPEGKEPVMFFRLSFGITVLFTGRIGAECEVCGLTPDAMVSVKLLNESRRIVHSFNGISLAVGNMCADSDGKFKFNFQNSFPTCQNKGSTLFMLSIVSTRRVEGLNVRDSIISCPFVVQSRLEVPKDSWTDFHQICSKTTYDEFVNERRIYSMALAKDGNAAPQCLTQYFLHTMKRNDKIFSLKTYSRNSFTPIDLRREVPDCTYGTNDNRAAGQIEKKNSASSNQNDKKSKSKSAVLEPDSLAAALETQKRPLECLFSDAIKAQLEHTIGLFIEETLNSNTVNLLDCHEYCQSYMDLASYMIDDKIRAIFDQNKFTQLNYHSQGLSRQNSYCSIYQNIGNSQSSSQLTTDSQLSQQSDYGYNAASAAVMFEDVDGLIQSPPFSTQRKNSINASNANTVYRMHSKSDPVPFVNYGFNYTLGKSPRSKSKPSSLTSAYPMSAAGGDPTTPYHTTYNMRDGCNNYTSNSIPTLSFDRERGRQDSICSVETGSTTSRAPSASRLWSETFENDQQHYQDVDLSPRLGSADEYDTLYLNGVPVGNNSPMKKKTMHRVSLATLSEDQVLQTTSADSSTSHTPYYDTRAGLSCANSGSRYSPSPVPILQLSSRPSFHRSDSGNSHTSTTGPSPVPSLNTRPDSVIQRLSEKFDLGALMSPACGSAKSPKRQGGSSSFFPLEDGTSVFNFENVESSTTNDSNGLNNVTKVVSARRVPSSEIMNTCVSVSVENPIRNFTLSKTAAFASTSKGSMSDKETPLVTKKLRKKTNSKNCFGSNKSVQHNTLLTQNRAMLRPEHSLDMSDDDSSVGSIHSLHSLTCDNATMSTPAAVLELNLKNVFNGNNSSDNSLTQHTQQTAQQTQQSSTMSLQLLDSDDFSSLLNSDSELSCGEDNENVGENKATVMASVPVTDYKQKQQNHMKINTKRDEDEDNELCELSTAFL